MGKGIDVRATSGELIFRTLLQDSAGALVSSGTTTLRLYELQMSDGTLKSYDFNDNTFKTGTLTTATLAMTHRQGNNNTVNTGIWTARLATLTGFAADGIYFAAVNNSGASPADQVREFQYGGVQGDGTVTSFLPDVNAKLWLGGTIPTPTETGKPLVNVIEGTGTGQLSLSGGKVRLSAEVQTGATVPTVTSVTNDVGITQAGADKAWSTAARTLTSGVNIVLAKGTGITGFNDLSAAQVNAEADAALADVGLTSTITGRIDVAIGTRLADADYVEPDNPTDYARNNVAPSWYTAPTTPPTVAAIRAEMDANSVDLNTIISGVATILATLGTPASTIADDVADAEVAILMRLGSPAAASVSADVAAAQAGIDDIQGRLPAALVGGRIDSHVGTMAADVITATVIATDAIGAAELSSGTVDELVSGVLAGIIEGDLTLRRAIAGIFASAALKCNGFGPSGTGTGKFRNLADTKDRITVNLDGDGNRLSVIFDFSDLT